MKIGLDIDGVCADFAPAANRWIAEHLGVQPLEVDRWDWFVHYGDSHEIAWQELWREILKPESTFWLDLKPCEGAVHGVRYLLEQGHSINFVTARPEAVAKQTIDWLRGTLGVEPSGYWDLTFTQDKTTTDCDQYVDDAPEHLMALAQAGKSVVCMARPWNAEWRRGLPTPIAKVHSLREYAQFLAIGQMTYGY